MHRPILLVAAPLLAAAGFALLAAAPRPTTAAAAPPIAAPPSTLTGQIVERLDAGPYRYLRVRPAAAPDAWIVLPAHDAPAGDAAELTVRVLRRAEHFRSPRLGREFPALLFAAPLASAPRPLPNPNPGAAARPPVPVAPPSPTGVR